MLTEYIKINKIRIILGVLVSIVCLNHLLFLAQMDYVVYDHDQRHTAKPALKGYYQLKDGEISDFIKGMFSHHQGYPRYPAFTGYLMALMGYFFGLNEVIMRFVTLIFYLILIFYTYKCAKDLFSPGTGLLSVLILITMPAVVFWSRMIFPDFFGTAFIMAAFYYMLKSKNFTNLFNSVLFGLFSGLSLLTHRVVFIPLFVLWVVAAISSFKKEKTVGSLKGFIFAFLTTFIISGNFLFTYFRTYDDYRDLTKYRFLDNSNALMLFERPGLLWHLKESIIQFGYDNLFVIFLLIIFIIIGKRKREKQNKICLFNYFFLLSFSVFLGVWLIVTYFSEIRLVNVRHFQIFAPMEDIITAFYINSVQSLFKKIFVFFKVLLIFSLLLMIIPRFGNNAAVSIFRGYYRIPNIDGGGNGVIWSNGTFARKEELNYFKNEISKGNIAVMNIPAYNHLVSLVDRLQLNGIGRAIPFKVNSIAASYMMFYCVSSYSLKEYLFYNNQYAGLKQDLGKTQSLLKIEKFINKNIHDELGSDEKVAIINTYGEFLYASIIEKYLDNFYFIKVKCFKYYTGDNKMYKVIFKCTENISEIENSSGWQENWCFLQEPNRWTIN